MGCHTWFYRRMEHQPTREDKIRACVAGDERFKAKIEEALANGGFVYRGEKRTWYPFGSEEEARERVGLLEWRIANACRYEDFKEAYDSIDWGSSEPLTREQELYAAVEHYKPGDLMAIEINGKYYENVPEFGDVFRYHEYGKVLESMDETHALLNTLGYHEGDGVWKRVDVFWDRYPDGIIEFG